MPADTRTAPSALLGRYWSGPVKKSRTRVIVAAATSPVTCDFPPVASATAVRESAPVTANPCDRPAAMLQTPSATNSRSTSIS